MHPRLLFVPLDDRPVCRDFVIELARSAGFDVRTPDRRLLGDRRRPGDVAGLWSWLETEGRAGGADALIASAEMLCFGGLVASRKSVAPFEDLAPLLDRLERAGRRLPTYLSAVIPRTPWEPGDEDAAYWQTRDQAARRRHRERHHLVNERLVASAASGAFRCLLIGQDDTAPGSDGAAERARLEARWAARSPQAATPAAAVLLTSGADELGARLLARCLNDLTGRSPSVRVLYTYPDAVTRIPRYEATPLAQTVQEHIESTGCHAAVEAVDILLWVHNFAHAQAEAVDQDAAAARGGSELPPEAEVRGPLCEARDAAEGAQIVALADVRFANGADRALVARLLEEPRFAGIVAYGGWNTCSNTLGSTLAQAVVAFHLRAHTVPGSDRAYREVLFTRILDDWGYQAVVRPRLADWLADRGGNRVELGDLEEETERQAAAWFRSDVLPRLQASFRYHPTALRRVAFPWHRLFEARLEVDVTRHSRCGPAGIVITDYDPVWVELFERDRAAIVGALGAMARGIEHVGSTSVPGLAAKPIIDILLGVGAGDLDRIIEPMQRIGYEYNPDWEISMPHRRYFRRLRPDGTATHHLHAVPIGGEFWHRHLRFRDYLRAHPAKAEEYAALKREIARAGQGSVDYTFAKTEFIHSIEALAGVEPGRP